MPKASVAAKCDGCGKSIKYCDLVIVESPIGPDMRTMRFHRNGQSPKEECWDMWEAKRAKS